jgi:spermidine synthase
MNRLYWKIFLITTGAASTAAEIAGLRLIAPIFGTSLPVWGGVIAAVIAGLAAGYWWGGMRAQRPTTFATVQRHAALAAAVFLLLPLGMHISRLLRDATLAGRSPVLMLAALVLAWLVMLPPSILFGMISPLAVEAQAEQRKDSAGYNAGAVFMLTTVGSLIGILLPSFVLVPLVGTRETIWLFAGAVLLLSAPALTSRRAAGAAVIGLALLIELLILRPLPPGTLYAKESSYQYITVQQEPDGTLALIFDAGFGIQSVKPPGLHTFRYWDYAAALPLYLQPEQQTTDVLVLGAAASTTERQLARFWPDRHFSFTSVEIDPAVLAAAAMYFDPPERNVVVADARTFVHTDANTYDLIVVDTYAREITVPFHLTTIEFFRQLKERLAPGGLIAINVNADSRDDLFIRSLARTLGRAVPEVSIISISNSCNHLLVGSAEPLPAVLSEAPDAIRPLLPVMGQVVAPASGGLVFTDNRAPTDLLGLSALCGF